MAVRLVQDGERIEIEEDEREMVVGVECRVEMLHECRAVGQTGKPVVTAPMVELQPGTDVVGDLRVTDDSATGRLLTNYLPGTAVLTNAPPLAAPGFVFTAHGYTLYALEAHTP